MATLFKRSNGIYYYVTSHHGRRVWRSTGARSRAEAEKFISSGFKSRDAHNPDLTLSQFTPQFLQYAETNLAPPTVLLYKQAIGTFRRLIGDFNLRSYTVQDVETFKVKRSREVSSVKVNIDFRTLKAFFQTALRWNLIQENPFLGVQQLKIPPKPPSYLSQDEFQNLLRVITIPWFKNLVIFAVSTMMRCGEIVSLTWNSIDLRRRVIFIQNTKDFRIKTSKPRAIPMNDWVYRFLATRENKIGRVFSFPNGKELTVGYVSRRFKKYVLKAGLNKEIHFHSLRHTGATWLVQEGVSIYAVQRLLGHSNISVTQMYGHLETDSLFNSVQRISLPID
ncbi:MAG TPA: tyrosine-type recombinase/integrase [Bacteroidota bacterium]|nr:tyrosine-type recombinase/integrase [Bacteroidota bacterium]